MNVQELLFTLLRQPPPTRKNKNYAFDQITPQLTKPTGVNRRINAFKQTHI